MRNTIAKPLWLSPSGTSEPLTATPVLPVARVSSQSGKSVASVDGVAVLVEEQAGGDLFALLGRHHHGAGRALGERHVEDDRRPIARGYAPRHRGVAEQRLKSAEWRDCGHALHHRHADHAGVDREA